MSLTILHRQPPSVHLPKVLSHGVTATSTPTFFASPFAHFIALQKTPPAVPCVVAWYDVTVVFDWAERFIFPAPAAALTHCGYSR